MTYAIVLHQNKVFIVHFLHQNKVFIVHFLHQNKVFGALQRLTIIFSEQIKGVKHFFGCKGTIHITYTIYTIK